MLLRLIIEILVLIMKKMGIICMLIPTHINVFMFIRFELIIYHKNRT